MRSKQLSFEYLNTRQTKKRYGRTQHGGAQTKGHRKLERPLSTKKWIHLVLKSHRANGRHSFLLPKNRQIVNEILKSKSKKFGIRVADFANVGNHLHLKIKIPHRDNFQKFLKSTTALIARKITGAKKGQKFGKFWQGLAFTRVLMSRLEELNLKGYIQGNRIEASKSYQARERFLENFNAWVYRERVKIKSLDPPADSTA